jgi:hypothetical protein
LPDWPTRRYIAGAVRIDREAIWDPGNDPDYEVPTAVGADSAIDVDTRQLRDLLVDGALFSNVKQGHFLWVDANGIVQYAPPRSLSVPESRCAARAVLLRRPGSRRREG